MSEPIQDSFREFPVHCRVPSVRQPHVPQALRRVGPRRRIGREELRAERLGTLRGLLQVRPRDAGPALVLARRQQGLAQVAVAEGVAAGEQDEEQATRGPDVQLRRDLEPRTGRRPRLEEQARRAIPALDLWRRRVRHACQPQVAEQHVRSGPRLALSDLQAAQPQVPVHDAVRPPLVAIPQGLQQLVEHLRDPRLGEARPLGAPLLLQICHQLRALARRRHEVETVEVLEGLDDPGQARMLEAAQELEL
mmetsp:Transcript_80470/g.209559  ORF Transcript_80470/g.209559 Transcript_80470/m.209559 type:complete len:250 (-) Transcript_80470:534-1283(-)